VDGKKKRRTGPAVDAERLVKISKGQYTCRKKIEWVERRREWDEHVTRVNAERLVKISRYNIPAGRRSPGRPKRRWSDLIPD